MANLIEVKVPDIGDFDSVPIIEIHVKAGDTVVAEQSLITLESDKASMDVPSSANGVIKELKVKIGVVKGKKLYDKRASIKERDMKRELQRSL